MSHKHTETKYPENLPENLPVNLDDTALGACIHVIIGGACLALAFFALVSK